MKISQKDVLIRKTTRAVNDGTLSVKNALYRLSHSSNKIFCEKFSGNYVISGFHFSLFSHYLCYDVWLKIHFIHYSN